MPSTTAATDPLSYYEVLSASWTAARTARGTDLRGQSLVNLDVFSSVPDGLVAELGSKLRPACIEHGLGQAGSGESSRIDVADAGADAPVLELHIQVPAAAGILGEAAAEDLPLYRTAEPNPVPPPEQDHRIAIPG
ncbi:MAG TPA: hypothetical protein VIY50_01540 [Steroidobacteraceae bacterium]